MKALAALTSTRIRTGHGVEMLYDPAFGIRLHSAAALGDYGWTRLEHACGARVYKINPPEVNP